MKLIIGTKYSSIQQTMKEVFDIECKQCLKGYYVLNKFGNTSQVKCSVNFIKIASDTNDMNNYEINHGWVNLLSEDGEFIYINNPSHPEKVKPSKKFPPESHIMFAKINDDFYEYLGVYHEIGYSKTQGIIYECVDYDIETDDYTGKDTIQPIINIPGVDNRQKNYYLMECLTKQEKKTIQNDIHNNKKFADYLVELLRKKDLTGPDVYKAGNFSKTVWSKTIKGDINGGTRPKEHTLCQIAIGLGLTAEEFEDFLYYTDYDVKPRYDLIYTVYYCLLKGETSFDEISESVYEITGRNLNTGNLAFEDMQTDEKEKLEELKENRKKNKHE